MKRLLIAALLAALGAPAFAVLSDVNARLADRGQPLLDNVPICAFELVASSNVTATKPAVNESKFLLSKTFDLTAKSVDQIVDVGQQPSFGCPDIALTLIGSEAWGSSMASTKRVGIVQYRYLSARFTGDYHPALRPDPHLVKVQVLT